MNDKGIKKQQIEKVCQLLLEHPKENIVMVLSSLKKEALQEIKNKIANVRIKKEHGDLSPKENTIYSYPKINQILSTINELEI